MRYNIRSVGELDRPWLRQALRQRWGSDVMISRGRLSRPVENPDFMAEEAGEPVGVITFEFLGGGCEVTSIDSLRPGQGIGGDLLQRVAAEARAAGCRRLWLVTTNDNLNALRFYQRRGLRLTAICPGAVDDTRRRKPEIPPVGEYGIPLRDEIELEMALE